MNHIFNLFKRRTFPITLSTKGYKTHYITQFRMRKQKDPNETRDPMYVDKTQLAKVQFIHDLFKKYFCSEQSLLGTRQSTNEDINRKICELNYNDEPEFEKWSSLEKDAIQNIKGVTSYNFDGLMMILLKSENLYSRAQSFLDYVNTVRVPNDITLANFMALAAECKDETKVFEAYEKIDKAFLVVPSLVLIIIEGLSKTSRWKECLELVHQLEEIYIPAWIALSQAAFKLGDTSTGKQLIQEIVQSGIDPKSGPVSTWLKLIRSLDSQFDVDWLINQLLTCLRKTEHLLTLPNALLLREIFSRKFRSRLSTVTMEKTGECPCCGYHLECPTLSEEEHAKLEKVFLEQLHKGSDTLHHSNPKELGIYLRFIEKSKPYDIVVDALNVAHNQPKKQPYYLAEQLLNVVSHLYHQKLKILVLGRKHIWFWNKSMITKVENMARCFYADNISSDDPFMIYGALYGGPKTLFMTSDMMRDHHYSLQDEETKALFRRWIVTRQVSFANSNTNSRLEIEPHQKYGIYAQGNWQDGWHIPYEKYEAYKYNIPFSKQKLHWICTKKKNRTNFFNTGLWKDDMK